jgi:hypothetical protein
MLPIGTSFAFLGAMVVNSIIFGDARRRRGMRYAVTDYRILFARPAPPDAFSAVSLANIVEVNSVDRGHGQGTIVFGPISSAEPSDQSGPNGERTINIVRRPRFVAIDDVGRVRDLIESARRNYREMLRTAAEPPAAQPPAAP